MKTYSDFMNAISADEVYEGLLGYGMFSEKIPPMFTSEDFLITVNEIIQSLKASGALMCNTQVCVILA